MTRRLHLTAGDVVACCAGAVVGVVLVLGVTEAILRRQVRP